MDSETGESFQDLETGEVPAGSKLNHETGEAECNYNQPKTEQVKRPFKIPQQYIKKGDGGGGGGLPKLQKEAANGRMSPKETRTVVTGDMSPAILFLLPTVFFFYPLIAIVLGVIEVSLHVWAHKKNKTLTNSNIYYRSPLHIIDSEFCAACKDEQLRSKITKLQDRRKSRWLKKYGMEYVRSIVT